ncbi:unnamed protein product [Symbiodinium microadriaticum]|nr:unnamed protein product [Symbiodinium microadriaticum]
MVAVVKIVVVALTPAEAFHPEMPNGPPRPSNPEGANQTVNITFFSRQNKKKRTTLHQLSEVQDIQVFEKDAWASPELLKEPMVVLRSAELRSTSQVVAAQLRTVLDEVALEPGELVDMLEENFKKFFDPETEQLFTGRKRQKTKPIMWMLKVILQPLMEEVKAALAQSLFPCNASMIHCGIWDWYLRGYANEVRKHQDTEWQEDPSNYFGGMHVDGKLMLGDSSREAEDIWGISPPNTTLNTPGAGWWNIWVLLSPEIGKQTLVLLDPRTWNVTAFLEHDRPFVWPERDLKDLKERPFKAPLSMQMGDLLAFHSFEVAHGAGQLMDVDSDAVRLSLDARCHCAEFSNRPVRTRRGEICAPVWFYGGQAQHGCQRIGSDEPWCVIYRQADEAGAGCILKNDTLCAYPCEAEEECSLQSFDYCG